MKLPTRKTLAWVALILLARTAGAEGSGAPPWRESFTARLEALAVLQTLNAELLSHDSATLTLDRWCAAHRLASSAHIVAERVDGAYQPPTDDQRQLPRQTGGRVADLAGLLRRVLQPVAGSAVLQDEPPLIDGVPERLAQSVGDGDQLRHRFTPRSVRPTGRRWGTG